MDHERRQLDRVEKLKRVVLGIVVGGAGVAVSRGDESIFELQDAPQLRDESPLLVAQPFARFECLLLDPAEQVAQIETIASVEETVGGGGEVDRG